MATSNNVLLNSLSGHIGKQLVVKKYGDKTVVTKYPDMSRRKLSVKQKKVNEIMENANYEAKKILASEELRSEAQVRLNVTSNKLYVALIREYFRKAKETGTGRKR